jgi:hypothetical protein
MPLRAHGRRRFGIAALAVVEAALALAGCGFITRSTIPAPFLRPGAPVFYLKIERYSLSETTTYKGTSVGTIVHSTRYVAVDLATCRKLSELTVDGKTWEQAWDPDDDDIWFAQDIGYKQARSFHGHEAALPKIVHPGVASWTTAGALRLVRPDDDGAGPAVWSFHTGRSTPVPPRPDPAGSAARATEQIRADLYGGRRLVGIEAPGPAGSIDIIVAEPADDPNAPPVVARRTLAVANGNETPLGVARDGHAILFGDQERALELFDLADGRRLWRHTLPPETYIVGPPSPVLLFLGPPDRRAGLSCGHTIATLDIPDCIASLDLLRSGAFALGETFSAGPRYPIVVDTRKGLTVPVSGRPRLPASVGDALYYINGDESRDRLYKVDFARGAAVPVEPYVGDIHFVAADPVSGTLVLSASSDDVLVYRASTGRIEKCIAP